MYVYRANIRPFLAEVIRTLNMTSDGLPLELVSCCVVVPPNIPPDNTTEEEYLNRRRMLSSHLNDIEQYLVTFDL
jgi:hypothetical protein